MRSQGFRSCADFAVLMQLHCFDMAALGAFALPPVFECFSPRVYTSVSIPVQTGAKAKSMAVLTKGTLFKEVMLP